MVHETTARGVRAATVVAVLAALLPMSVARAQADAEPASAPATSPEVDLVVTMHDGGGHVLRLDSESGRLLAEMDADPDTAAGADGIVVGPDGLLYVSGHGSDSVERYDPVDNSHVDTFVASGAAGLDAPRGLAFGPGGDLYVVSGNTGSLLRFDGSSGAPAGTLVDGELRTPRGLVVGGDGDIYVADAGEDTIERFDPTGLPLGTFARLAPGAEPTGLAWDSDGNLLVTAFAAGRVERYDGRDGRLLDVVTDELVAPSGIVAVGYTLWVADYWTDQVVALDAANGRELRDPITLEAPAGPRGLALVPARSSPPPSPTPAASPSASQPSAAASPAKDERRRRTRRSSSR